MFEVAGFVEELLAHMPMEKFCGACLSMHNIQTIMVKGAKKAERWWRKWCYIKKITWIPHENAQKEEILI